VVVCRPRVAAGAIVVFDREPRVVRSIEEDAMKCPVCVEPTLVMSDRQGVEIDYCPQCRGVWLDRGELDKILERSRTEQPVPPAAAPAAPAPQPAPRYDEPRYEQPRRDPKYDDRYDPRYSKKRKKNMFEELFDF
jgi:Zn-finger nucleic acid-binding protein